MGEKRLPFVRRAHPRLRTKTAKQQLFPWFFYTPRFVWTTQQRAN
jgi:hypothetical protein